MDDAFSRRGFARMALLSGAALLTPRIALAKEPPRLALALSVPPLRDRLDVALSIRNEGARAVSLLPYVIATLEGRLEWSGAARVAVSLERHDRPPVEDLRSRAGPRLSPPPTVLRAESVTYYGRYAVAWPATLPVGAPATLTLRPRLRAPGADLAARPRADLLRAVEALRARAELRRPA